MEIKMFQTKYGPVNLALFNLLFIVEFCKLPLDNN
jgi:hypothetical protein